MKQGGMISGRRKGDYSLGIFWSSTPYDNETAVCLTFNGNEYRVRLVHYDKLLGLSCRCVRD